MGLEAQRKTVLDYLDGGKWTLVAQHTEVESGKHAERLELAKALVAGRKHKAKLVIAKLDRLSRNRAFRRRSWTAESSSWPPTNPHAANRLTVHILAAVAGHERQMISERTKAAPAAAKAGGKRAKQPQSLAGPRGLDCGPQQGR